MITNNSSNNNKYEGSFPQVYAVGMGASEGREPRVGFPQPGKGPHVRTSSQALMQISRGRLTAKKAFQTGQLIVSKGEGDPYEAVQVIHKMFFQQEIVS